MLFSSFGRGCTGTGCSVATKKNERRQSGTDGQTLWACSMRAGGGTARGHGECGAGTRGGAAPRMGLGLAGPGLGLVWVGSGLGRAGSGKHT